MGIENLGGVALGGLIGFLSAIGVEAVRRAWDVRDRRKKLNRLLKLLFEEVEQLAELLAIDLRTADGGLPITGVGGKEEDTQVRATIARLKENRTIYESQAERFLELPGYLPNALVRFYTRLEINCAHMLSALDKRDWSRVSELRDLSSHEAESLKIELREAMCV